MVAYRKWVSILFETYPEADATEVMSRAGETWSANRDLLRDASVGEARELAKQA